MVCFEWNLHAQISWWRFRSENYILVGSCSGHYAMAHYDITIGNNIARDVHCDILMDHDIVMGTYHNITMHTDVARTLI